MKRKIFLHALLYYTIACAIAWPIFLNMSYFQELLKPIGVQVINPFLIIMWGPGLAALLCYFIFRKSITRKISLFGKKWVHSLLFFIVPWSVFFILNLFYPVSEQYAPKNFLVLIPVSFVFTLVEELGWRGFLEDALKSIPRVWRWLFIGLMWEIWHLRFLWIDENRITALLKTAPFLLVTIALSFLLGYSTERSKSLVVPITLHLWANTIVQSPHWVTFLSVGLSGILWFYLLYKWPSQAFGK